MNIVLIGFMGSGKSTVANLLSKLMEIPYIETDELVFQKTNTHNMNEVFALGGEEFLRQIEGVIAKEYASKANIIISTGGGIVLNKSTLDDLTHPSGRVFFLNASFETIMERLAGDKARPLLKQSVSDVKKLYDFRLPLYMNYADEIINADIFSAVEIAAKIKVRVSDGF